MRGMCMSLSGLSECYGGCAECGGCIYLSRVSMSSLMCVCMGEGRGEGGCEEDVGNPVDLTVSFRCQ